MAASPVEEFPIDPALVSKTPCPVCGAVPAQILWRSGKPTRYIHSDDTVHKDPSVRLTVGRSRGEQT